MPGESAAAPPGKTSQGGPRPDAQDNEAGAEGVGTPETPMSCGTMRSMSTQRWLAASFSPVSRLRVWMVWSRALYSSLAFFWVS